MPESLVGEPFETVFAAGQTGLVGTIKYRIDDNEGNTVVAATSAGIIELGTTGIYSANPTAPGTAGDWSVIWSPDGTFDPATNGVDDLVTFDTTVPVPPTPPLTPISSDDVDSVGPCQAWTDADTVAECCDLASSDTSVLDDAIVAASQVLYALVPKFPGTCGPIRVRPPGDNRCAGPPLDWLWSIDQWAPSWAETPVPVTPSCGCTSLSRILLAGRVREVQEVTIDGAIISADTYRLDSRTWLTRVPDPTDPTTRLRWPACQNMELPYTSEGTFSVLYTYGADPPVIGVMAAGELACAIYQACNGDDECPLPVGTVQVVRSGLTVNAKAFQAWGWQKQVGAWTTGMPLVDMFLNAYAPFGRQRRGSLAWSPDMQQSAPKLGV